MLKYIWAYIVPALIFLSLRENGWVTYMAIIAVFGLIPLIELLVTGSEQNMDEASESLALQNTSYDWVLYGLVPVQYFLGIYFLIQMQDADLLWWERLGKILAFGLSCGILGINAAHELGHRKTKYEQWMSKALLATTLYLHFFIEHNKGHHLRVATPDDPASARRGENLYSFFIRSIRDSWFSAWKIEKLRLEKQQLRFWSMHNEMLVFQLAQLLIMATIGFYFGVQVLIWYILSAFMGILLLETVNYIEHYGLERKKNDSGYYERTMPVHSWNSNHPLGRILLLELTRHSDHHYQASRKYQILRHFDESPQMPTGYPGMMVLAFIPPLWFAVMHREIGRFRQSSPTSIDLA